DHAPSGRATRRSREGRNVRNARDCAVATGSAGGDGRAVTSDGKLDVGLTAPVELGGSGAGTNPEQLFAAGYAACFGSALGAVGRAAKVDVSEAAVTAGGVLGKQRGCFAPALALRIDH